MPTKVDPRTLRLARSIGAKFKEARLAADLSQETLATNVGMTRTNYARIEQGKTNATLETMIRIADGLGLVVTVDFGPARRSTRRT